MSRRFETIKQMFARRNRTMPERNRVQAFFPAGADVIPNPARHRAGLLDCDGDGRGDAGPAIGRHRHARRPQRNVRDVSTNK